jgi:hypothetical protein
MMPGANEREIDDPKVPLVLLIYALETSITTATCIVEYTTWQIETQAKWDLTGLYGPYLAVGEYFCSLGMKMTLM